MTRETGAHFPATIAAAPLTYKQEDLRQKKKSTTKINSTKRIQKSKLLTKYHSLIIQKE
jgi:hypothetical protein